MEKLISAFNEKNKINIINTSKYWLFSDTEKYLDLQMGNSAFIFGYSDQEIINSINSNKIKFVRNGEGETSLEIQQVVFSLLKLSNMSALSWTVSGTDAVETAVAISDHYWKIVDPRKNKILSLVPCYHGSSWLTRSLRSELPTDICRYVDAPAWLTIDERNLAEEQCIRQIKQQLSDHGIGSIIIESIPWVLGVYPFSDMFWVELKKLCNEYDVLLILDDVAGCFGKIGQPFSNVTLGIEVDIIAAGKSISGGYSPIGAAMINDRVFNAIGDTEWNHTYTYNPNMLGISSIAAVLNKVDQGVFDNIDLLKNKTEQLLLDIGLPCRSQGLCFDIITDTGTVYNKFRKAGFSFNAYNSNSIPLVVPLIADDEYFDFLKKGLVKIYEI
jgi:adenosylmethionine-8-amino-7-oxononanoate aminotransferase